MKINLLTQVIAAFLLTCIASATDILPYLEAFEKAKTEKKSIIVLSDGSDWMPNSPEIRKAYQKLVEGSSLDDKVIWAIKDDKSNMTEEEERAAKDLPSPPLKVWFFPGLQIVDTEGRGVFLMQKLTPQQIAQAGAALQKAVQSLEKRDQYWAQAAKIKGPQAAELLAKGLELMPSYALAYRPYNAILDRLKKEDPEDKKGYYLRFTFNSSGFLSREINPLLKEKKYKEAYALVDKLLQSPGLTKDQRQHASIAKWRIAQVEGNRDKALQYLKQTANMNLKTRFGQDCLRLYNFYTQPIYLPSLRWFDIDIRPDWTLTFVKVGSAIKGAGTYEIKFEQLDSKTRFRNLAFKSGKQTLASIKDNKEGYTFELTLTSKTPSNIVLEFESRGSEHGAGKIIITKKS